VKLAKIQSTAAIQARKSQFASEATDMITGAKQRPIELRSGDRLTRKEFHRLYEETAEDFRAQLVGGIVYVTASRTPISHGKSSLLFCAPLSKYESQTPGVDACSGTTFFLGDDSEPEPDLHLRISAECGGQTKISDEGYLVGAPEFIVEIAYRSVSIEMHAKKDDYARYGVREYLVHCLEEQELRWFDLPAGKELQPDASGIFRIHTFPGLWIKGPAVLARDYQKMMQTLEDGLATPEHAAFVRELESRRAKT
jgi:Uma2 family endonuclease